MTLMVFVISSGQILPRIHGHFSRCAGMNTSRPPATSHHIEDDATLQDLVREWFCFKEHHFWKRKAHLAERSCSAHQAVLFTMLSEWPDTCPTAHVLTGF